MKAANKAEASSAAPALFDELPAQTAAAPNPPPANSTGTGRRIASGRKGKLIAFGWYGGKFSHLDFLLPLLPDDATHFCDVYGGSAAVILNAGPYPVETYNDLDSDLVNFFRTLRERCDELVHAIRLTPFSREELEIACTPEPGLDDVERARRFFIRAKQTRTGLAQKSSSGRWAHCVLTSRNGMSGSVSRLLGSVDRLDEISARLSRIQVEHASALDVIARYDTKETLFYVDPPYVHSTRGDRSAYGNEMSDGDHEELAALLRNVKGRVLLSGYRSEMYDRLYAGWRRVDAKEKLCHSVRKKRQESAWLNY